MRKMMRIFGNGREHLAPSHVIIGQERSGVAHALPEAYPNET